MLWLTKECCEITDPLDLEMYGGRKGNPTKGFGDEREYRGEKV